MKKVLVVCSLIIAFYITENAAQNVYDDLIINGLTVTQYTNQPNYWIVVLTRKDNEAITFNGTTLRGFYYNLGVSTTFTDEGKAVLAELMYAHSSGKKIMVRINNSVNCAQLTYFLPNSPMQWEWVHSFDWVLIRE